MNAMALDRNDKRLTLRGRRAADACQQAVGQRTDQLVRAAQSGYVGTHVIGWLDEATCGKEAAFVVLAVSHAAAAVIPPVCAWEVTE